jgi:hypothetical protein
VHTVPHVPQFIGSVCTSTHELPHIMSVVVAHTQCPPVHTYPAPHWVSQVPQCCTSVLTSRQVPPQPRRGAWQPQVPSAQLVPVGHTFPQLPQLFESPTTRVQVPPQLIIPGMHVTFASDIDESGIGIRPSGAKPASSASRRTVHAPSVRSIPSTTR